MFKINIISNSENYKAEAIIVAYRQLLTARKWHSWQVNFDIEQSCGNSSVFIVSGGSALLPKQYLQFVSVPLTCEAKAERKTEIEKWAENFDSLIEIADLSLIEDENYLKQAGEASHALSIIGKESNALVLAVGCENVLENIRAVEDIDFEQYTNLIHGIHSAIAGENFNGIKLKKDKINSIQNFLHYCFFSPALYLETELDNALTVRSRFFCNHGKLQHSGYIESFFAVLEQLYEKDLPQGIEINNIINNKIYNIMCFSKLFKIRDEENPNKLEHIKVAVVGTANSGKTFMIDDMIRAFSKLSYTPTKDVRYNDKNNYGSLNWFTVTLFKDRITKGGHGQTDKYCARQPEHFVGIMKKQNRTPFILEVMNIPGESVTDDSYAKFKNLENVIKSVSEKKFKIEECRNTTDVQLLVSFEDSSESLPTPTYNPNDTGQYYSYSNVKGYYTNKKYTIKEKEWCTGEDILRNFYSYNIDSLITALTNCWKSNSTEFGNAFPSGTNETDFMQSLYFVKFCSDATDIVVCSKLAVTDKTSAVNPQRKHETTFFTCLTSFFRGQPNKNFYLAFRGLDALIRNKSGATNNPLQEIFGSINGFSGDKQWLKQFEIYAFLMIWLGYNYKEIDNKHIDKLKNKIKEIVKCNGFALNGKAQNSLNNIADDTNTAAELKKLFGKKDTDFWLPDSKSDETLNKRIRDVMIEWSNICEKTKLVENEECQVLPFLPHVYFSAYPIHENDLWIAKNQPDRGKFDRDPSIGHSLTLGANELVFDILYARKSKINFKFNENNQPLLLSYMINTKN
jgi:hypothetical protein